ncbi:regulator of sigma E protease [Chryseomicrobium aureum]|uniref:RIP metalloprotease RseP n=1 Tax=Chryseomicrobium aureum TaxID=1441723 RepID=UPI0019579AEF|nr:RIP metalloprotease RseP [Chryseomicrobium aureum]MBM7705409.1 regulator of sigma E protease [Chryseomicrobium aureum]
METAIAFILIFGSIVFFHELGHFIFAKRAGIMVREFAIGMGPKLLGYTKGETVYTIRMLPIGGYVRMAGEDLDAIELQPGYRIGVRLNEKNEVDLLVLNQKNYLPDMQFLEIERADLMNDMFIEGYDESETFVRYTIARDAKVNESGRVSLIAPYDRQFHSKTVGQRSLAIFAGPLFNFILAFLVFTALAIFRGIPTDEPLISSVVDDSPAAVAGLVQGDEVTAIDGESVASWSELALIIQENPETPLTFDVERDGQPLSLEITPNAVENGEQVIGQIGVQSPLEKSILGSFAYGATQTYEWTVLIFQLLGNLITGQFSIDDLSGPVGIYKATEEVAKFGIFNLMNWTAVLSINLGIMNLLPLPALDGGRLLFFGFEALRGRPVDKQREGMVHFVGIMLLMVLMIVVTWNDIQRFFF